MQKFLRYFEDRNMEVDLTLIYQGEIYTITQAKTERNGHEIKAEGAARRSLDVPDSEMGQRISGGRAIKALYLKVSLLEQKNVILAQLAAFENDKKILAPGQTLKVSNYIRETKKRLLEELRLVEKKLNRLIHGRYHLLMG